MTAVPKDATAPDRRLLLLGLGAMPVQALLSGCTTQNWLGRSQYAADPTFNGRMQELRLYSGALSAQQVAALAAG